MSGFVVPVVAGLWCELVTGNQATLDALASQSDRLRYRFGNKLAVVGFPDVHTCCVDPQRAKWINSNRLSPQILVPSGGVPIQVRAVDEDTLRQLRQSDLEALFKSRAHRALIGGSARYHFAVPSGTHVSQFFRVAEAITSSTDLDKLSYWTACAVLESVERLHWQLESVQLVMDTPALLSIGVRVCELLGLRAPSHCLQSYPTGFGGRREIESILRNARKSRRVSFFLVSVASSGRLQELIDTVGKELAMTDSLLVLPLYGMPGFLGSPLCSLTVSGFAAFPAGAQCQLCNEGSTAVPISASTLAVQSDVAKEVAIPPKLFKKQRDFLDKFGSVPGALRVHYDDPNEQVGRHHAFYVDVQSLMMFEPFRRDVEQTIRSLSRPDIVLSPNHGSARDIALLASEIHGVKAVAHDSFDLKKGTKDDELISALRECRKFLVVDDVCMTGARFSTINRSFRSCDAFQGLSEVTFFAPLSLSDDSAQKFTHFRGVRANHGRAAEFKFVHELHLPSWHSPDMCPWCEEERELSRVARAGIQMDSPLTNRVAVLQDKKSGLVKEWMHTKEGALPLTVGRNSPVLRGGTDAIVLLFAVASALQQARTEGVPVSSTDKTSSQNLWTKLCPKSKKQSSKPSETVVKLNPHGFPVPVYLAKRTLCDNYTERLFWAAFLRGSARQELGKELRTFLYEKIDGLDLESDTANIALELAVAVYRGMFGDVRKDRATDLLTAG